MTIAVDVRVHRACRHKDYLHDVNISCLRVAAAYTDLQLSLAIATMHSHLRRLKRIVICELDLHPAERRLLFMTVCDCE